jgi:phosphate/sulfate permease
MNNGELVGTIGVSLLLIAFALNLAKKLSVSSSTYLVLNIIGAGLAGVSSYMIQFRPFVVLEGVWTISSIIMLIRTKHVSS